ncbi:MAG: hypothetical protein ACRETL_09485, partial [Gammaproteobacteria bacterium]
MLSLTQLNPGDPVLMQLNAPLKSALQSALAADTSRKDWVQAEKTLFDYAPLLNLEYLLAQRSALSQSEIHAHYVPADMSARTQQIQQHRTDIANVLAKPVYDSDWDNHLMNLTRETAALLQPRDLDWFKQVREKTAASYVALAEQMTKQNRFNAAAALLATGREYAPQLPGFVAATQNLATAQKNFEQLQVERLRTAQLTALEYQFQIQLNAGQISDARKTYSSLQHQLPANDKFFTMDAPQEYASAYLNLARARAATGDYRGAIALVQGGLQYAPLDSLKKALQDYTAEAQRADLMASIDKLQPDDMGKLKAGLAKVQQQLPQEQAQIS